MKKTIIILIAVLFGTILNAQTKSEDDDILYYRQLLQERRELAAQGDGDILPTVEDVLIDFAFLLIEREKFSEALPLLEELLDLAAKGQADGLNVEAIEEELARVLEEIGDEYYAKNDYNTAEKYYLRSLKVNEKLVKNDNTSNLPDVARLLTQIGNIYHNHRKDYRKAEKYYLQSLSIDEKLVQARPNSTIRSSNLSIVLRNIGLNYYEMKNYKKAENYYLRSLQIREKLVQEQPDKYFPPFITLLDDFGRNFIAQKNYEEAVRQFQRSLQICERLIKEDSDTYLVRLAVANGNLSWAYLFLKSYHQSEMAAYRALRLDNTQLWVKVNLAHALLFQNRFSEAENIYMELSKTIEKDDKTFTPTILDDFNVLEKANAIPKNHKADVEKIKKKLKIKS